MAKPKFDADAFYERLFGLAQRCRELTERIPRTPANLEYSRQLIRASSSVGSNYIEALEAMSKKDFIYRLKVSRKEARESSHWLRLLLDANQRVDIIKIKNEMGSLVNEAMEIMKIFTSSILTSRNWKLGY